LPQLTALLLHVLPVLVAADRDSVIHETLVDMMALPDWLRTALPTHLVANWADVIQWTPAALAAAPLPRDAMAWARTLVLIGIWFSEVVRAFCFARHSAMLVRPPSRRALQVFMPLLQRSMHTFLSAPTLERAHALVHACAAGLLEARIADKVVDKKEEGEDEEEEAEPPFKRRRGTVQ
jgi:hypothetical protein